MQKVTGILKDLEAIIRSHEMSSTVTLKYIY